MKTPIDVLIFMPVGPDSAFPDDGITALMFDMPGEEHLVHCGDVIIYRATMDGEHKIGSDSSRKWIAALAGDTLILQRTAPGEGEGTHPDGGCTVEMYANTDLGYVEIESLSIEKTPEPGDYFDNTLTLSLHRLESVPEDVCELADLVRELVGEPTQLERQPAVDTEPDVSEEAIAPSPRLAQRVPPALLAEQ